MARKIVIDSSSLLNFFRYYYFDKNNGNQINTKLREFIISRIKNGEIIVLDKVNDESQLFDSDFMREIKSDVVKTTIILNEVLKLSKKHYVRENERFFTDPNEIEIEMQHNENTYADLFLVAYCLFIKSSVGDKPILITDETLSIKGYRKLLPKIPTMCKSEGIEYRNIAYLLFEIYKQELQFELKISK